MSSNSEKTRVAEETDTTHKDTKQERHKQEMHKFYDWLEIDQYFPGTGFPFAEEAALQLHFVLDVVEAHGGAARLLVLVHGRGDLWPGRPVGANVFYHRDVDVIGSFHCSLRGNTLSDECLLLIVHNLHPNIKHTSMK